MLQDLDGRGARRLLPALLAIWRIPKRFLEQIGREDLDRWHLAAARVSVHKFRKNTEFLASYGVAERACG